MKLAFISSLIHVISQAPQASRKMAFLNFLEQNTATIQPYSDRSLKPKDKELIIKNRIRKLIVLKNYKFYHLFTMIWHNIQRFGGWEVSPSSYLATNGSYVILGRLLLFVVNEGAGLNYFLMSLPCLGICTVWHRTHGEKELNVHFLMTMKHA